MKTILCYGDSNTWGYTPNTGAKIPFEKKWPGIMQARLGTAARVIDEGLNGRTTRSLTTPSGKGETARNSLWCCCNRMLRSTW